MDLLKKILETKKVAQDKDIKDREGTQPSKYFSGVSKKSKEARDRHFKKGAKMDDNNPAAYKPAPGDAGAKTKPSQHTKKFQQMFGENYDGDMAQNALENIIRNANNLKRVVREDGDYPAWWNSKLTKADDYLDVCHDYLMSELSQSEQIDEGKLVASLSSILTAMTNKWQKKAEIEYKKNPEKGLSYIQRLGSIIGARVTDKEQEKGKLFLKMGDELSEAVDVKKALSKVKGLTRQQMQVLSTMSPSTLQIILQQLSSLAMGEEIEEGYAERQREKTKSQQKAHQKAMMKSARDSIKKYQKGKKEETEVEEEAKEDPKEKAHKERVKRERERNLANMRKSAEMQKDKIAKARADSKKRLDMLKDKETARQRAERENRPQTEEKNCGCGNTPCETYGIVDDNLPEQKKVDIKKMFARVKGLSKKQLEVLASIPTPQLHVIVQQLSGLTMGEDFEPFNTIDEALSIQQRIKRGMIARRTAKKRSRMRKLKARRMKNAGELQQKAMRAARTRLAKRMLGSLNMADLSISQKVNLAKKLEKKKGVIKKLSKRLLPAVRKQEMQRLKKFRQAQQNESISLFKDWWSEAANAAQQAAIAIAKKKKQKNEEPKYNLGDGNCNDSYLELGTDRIRQVYSKDTPGQANESMDPRQFSKNNFVVSYQNKKRKEKEKLVFGANMQKDAINYANKANKVDKDGGQYTVYKNNRGVLKSIAS